MKTVPVVDDLILAADLRTIGLDARAYRRACDRGELFRPHRGVYVPAQLWRDLPPWDRYRLQVLGAARASRSAPTLCHASAAALWNIPLVGRLPQLVHVLSSPAVGTRAEGGFRRHASSHRDIEVVEREGVSVTSLARTLVELAADMPFTTAVAAIDWALSPEHRGDNRPVVTKSTLMDVADSLGIVRGRRRIERAVDFADGASESPGESLSRATMHELGFPAPILQAEFFDRRGSIGRVDFWWPDSNLIGEFDGVAKYVSEKYTGGKPVAEIVIAEKKRENRLRATGPLVTRWDWDIASSSHRLFAHLMDAGLPSSRRTSRRSGNATGANAVTGGGRGRPW